MFFRQVFEPKLAQYAYVIGCQRTGEAIVIDPMRDLDRYDQVARDEGLEIVAATETHIHADYLSGVREYVSRGVRAFLSAEGGDGWAYAWPELESGDGDIVRVSHGDTFSIGHIKFQVVHSPGHTPEHIAFLVTDIGGGATEPMGLASGDFVFVGDLGRPDLLESAAGQVGAMRPAAQQLYDSAQSFLELPDYLQVWPGHGAGSACGKALGAVPETTVGYERRFSPALDFVQQGEDPFVEFILDGQPEPPVYFARMKQWNRDGPPLLGAVPTPTEWTSAQLRDAQGDTERANAVLDTRGDRTAFMKGHLAGSLYAPADNTFPTIAGSYVQADEQIVLIADPADVADLTLDLIRIGLDHVVAWARPEALSDVELVSTPVAHTSDLADLASADAILDVRRATEFAEARASDAVNIAHTRLAARSDEIPAGKRLWVHCRSGARAAAASAFLERAGHDVVYVDGAVDEIPTLTTPATAPLG